MLTLLVLTKEAEEWLLNHAEDGGDHGWRCKEARTEIRFVRIKHLIRVSAPEQGPCPLETIEEVYYPQCNHCPGSPAIGDPNNRLEIDDLVSVFAERRTQGDRAV